MATVTQSLQTTRSYSYPVVLQRHGASRHLEYSNPVRQSDQDVGSKTPGDAPGLDLKRNTQYLDLFAFRESNQEVAIKEVIQIPALFPYVVEQVSLTQEILSISLVFMVQKNLPPCQKVAEYKK